MSLGFIEEALKAFAVNIKIVSLTGTFQRLIWPGDSLFARGLIVRRYKKNGEHRVLFSTWCENQNDEIVMKGSAICLLFKNAEEEQKSKLSSPQISKDTLAELATRCTNIVNQAQIKVNDKLHSNKELVQS